MLHRPRSVVYLLLGALLIRLIWAIAQSSTPATIDRLPDQREYLTLAQNLLHHGTFSFYDSRFEQTVYAYRTPGYPFFIASLGASPQLVRIAQAFIDTSTALAVFLLARQLSPRLELANFACLLIGFNPFLIYFSGLILSETLFTALLTWSVVLLVSRRFKLAAFVLLAAIYVRPSVIALVPILTILPFVLNLTPAATYCNWPGFLAVVGRVGQSSGIVVIGLLPWAIRNHAQLHQWIWTTTNGGITFYDGFHPGATGNSDQRFVTQMPALKSMNEVDRSRFLESQASEWACGHKAELFGLTARKIARTWSPMPLSQDFGRPVYRWISALYAVPFDLLVLAGIFSPRVRAGVKIWLLAPAVYFTMVHALSVGSLRYRIPVEPELSVLAAGGAIAAISLRRTEGLP